MMAMGLRPFAQAALSRDYSSGSVRRSASRSRPSAPLLPNSKLGLWAVARRVYRYRLPVPLLVHPIEVPPHTGDLLHEVSVVGIEVDPHG